jgi:hypothetical protein
MGTRARHECIDETVYPYRWFHDETMRLGRRPRHFEPRALSHADCRSFQTTLVPGSWFPAAFAELTPSSTTTTTPISRSRSGSASIHLRPPVFDAGKATLNDDDQHVADSQGGAHCASSTRWLLAANCADRAIARRATTVSLLLAMQTRIVIIQVMPLADRSTQATRSHLRLSDHANFLFSLSE